MDKVVFHIKTAQPERTVNILSALGVSFHNLQSREDTLIFTVPLSQRDTVRSVPGITVEREREKGVLKTLQSIKWRFMLYTGLCIALLALVVSSLLIWRIDVAGAKNVPEEQIVSELRGMGIGIFSPFWVIQNRSVQNELMLRIPELSWAAVNVKGTRLFVLVREKTPKPEIHTPSDEPITAKKFGIVESAVAVKGTAQVKKGDTAAQGDVLITPDEDGAVGSVIARTFYKVETEIPTLCKLKLTSSGQKTRYALIIGEKRINFYNSNRHNPLNYDTIEVKVFADFLPIKLEKTTETEWKTTLFSIPEERAVSILKARLARTINAQIGEGSVIREEFSHSVENGIAKVSLYAECRENIAS